MLEGFISGRLFNDSDDVPKDHWTELFKLFAERTFGNEPKELDEAKEVISLLFGFTLKSGRVEVALEPLNILLCPKSLFVLAFVVFCWLFFLFLSFPFPLENIDVF